MKETMLRSVGWGVGPLLALFFVSRAHAADANKTNVNFDFVSRQVVFYGLYVPQSEKNIDGLSAELYARRDGIAHLTSKLQESCRNTSASDTAVRPSTNGGWISSVRSQGSEIYANGVLKISLTAPVREVFKEFPASSFALKTKTGSPLNLRFPLIPIERMSCGKLRVAVRGKMVEVNPFTLSKDATAQTIRLVFQGNTLTPASPDDTKILEESNLFVTASGSGESQVSKPATVPASPSE